MELAFLPRKCNLLCLLLVMLIVKVDPHDDTINFCYKENGEEVCGGKESLHLTRIQGKEVGEEEIIQSGDRKLTLKTVSTNPLIIEIPNFLSSAESEHFISVAEKQGLVNSQTGINDREHQMGLIDLDQDGQLSLQEMRLTIENAFDVYPDDDDIIQMYVDVDLDSDRNGNISRAEMSTLSPADMRRYIDKFIKLHPEKHSRYSQQVWMYPDKSTDQTFVHVQIRVSDVVNLPMDIIRLSNFQVVKYGPDGHYNAHFDSARKQTKYPCCTRFPKNACRVCRYMTILFYLNDVEEGGETAFVLAGNDSITADDVRLTSKVNLYRKCSESLLHVKPEKGKAIIWYNHFIDPETKWLGEMDDRTLHGGCPVKKGEKWIGNFWVRVSDTMEQDLIRIEQIHNRSKEIKTEL